MTATAPYILNSGDTAVIGYGATWNYQMLPASDARVVAYLAAQAAAQTINAAVAAAITGGINLTSAGTPSLNGNYSCGQSSVANVNAVMTYILANPGTFPGSGSTINWYDSSGTAHTFPNTATFQNFAAAFAGYVAAVQEYALSGGTSGPLPSPNISIP
jgi:hypothetical protein